MVTARRTVLGFLAAATLAASGFPGEAAAAAPAQALSDSGQARLEVDIEADSGHPHVGEMILVSLKGFYGLKIALQTFGPAPMRNFTWLQLGPDAWSPARVDGRDAVTLERRFALYPQRAGTLTIGPFRQNLTLVSRTGERLVREVVSNAVTVTVSPRPETAGDGAAGGGWWLPARQVTVSEEWDMDPSRLPDDTTATRTVTITAVGQPAEALPPPPAMREPRLISFIAPEERSTATTRDGPVGTVRWQWRIRPATSEPGRLPSVAIPWFDTTARKMREVVLPGRSVAFASVEAPLTAEIDAGSGAWIATLALGLILPPAFALFGRRLLSPRTLLRTVRPLLPDRDTLSMRLALWRNDPVAYRRHARRRFRTLALPFPAAGTVDLDNHLFGAEPSPTLDLPNVHLGLPRKRSAAFVVRVWDR